MKKSTVAGWVLVLLVAGGVAFALTRQKTGSGSGSDGAAAVAGPASAASAVISVSTMRAQQRDFKVELEATGSVTALNSVDVRAQVSTVISKVHIREGQFVKAGDLLFSLDSRADEANVQRARAQLQKDQASLADAQRQLARSKDLLAQNFISQGAVDTNQTLVEGQQATVAADRAAIESAAVNLSYARIVSPSSGRAGAINVYAGSYVTPSTASLVTITQLDPVAVSFNLPQRNLADALDTLRAGGGSVRAVLPEGRGTLDGKLQFVDNSVDANSGTVRVKAVFDNKNQQLWPGAFVVVRLTVQTLKDAIVVPQAAIVQSPRGKIVFVAEPSNKAAARPVEVVYASGVDAVVTGIKPGERVVLEGRQNLRPGVSVVERSASGAAGAGRRGAAASGASARPASAAGSGAKAGALP